MTVWNRAIAGFLTIYRNSFNLAAISQSSGAFEEASHCIQSALIEERKLFKSSILDQTDTITQFHAENKDTTIREHEKTRSILLDAVRKVDSSEKRISVEENGQLHSQEQDLEVRRRAENHLLRNLRISSVSERYNRIVEAHATTFQWIFKVPTANDRPWSDFARWLKYGDGIYWINGKAGSGKSTLMRYIYDCQQTRDLLKEWCGDLPLTIAAFFFWNSGTPDQKSQNGLLRTLIHELLSQHRELIPIAFPDHWRDLYVNPIERQQDFLWTRNVLKQAFHAIRTQSQIRTCLFIDGLDECEGDRDGNYEEIVSFFTGLLDSANIKICISSRPWLAFEDAFGRSPSLKLQDLTFNDITCYVDDKINGHSRMRDLRCIDPEIATNLTHEIVTKSSGVFLWVHLAVRSLLDGFTNRDHISDLQKRLQELPADLESFYKNILLNHIRPFYHEQSSQMFQMVQAANTGFIGCPPLTLSLLMLSFTEETESALVLNPPKRLLKPEDRAFRCSEMAARLKSQCGGLLEVSGTWQTVGYLHHSVRDFLNMPDTQELLLSRTKQSFNPDERLFKACLLHLKYVMSTPGNQFDEVSCLVQHTLNLARKAMATTGDSYAEFLDELDKTVMDQWLRVPRQVRSPQGDLRDLRMQGAHWANFLAFRESTNAGTLANGDNFLSLAVLFGLRKYVEAKFEEDRTTLSTKSGRPLLDYIVFSEFPIEAEMVSLLLRNGADPNKEFCGCSIWQYALELIELLREPFLKNGLDNFSNRRTLLNPNREVLSHIFKLLVEGRADPNVLCMHIKNSRSSRELPKYAVSFSTPSKIFSPGGLFPDAKLANLVKSRGGVEFLESIQLRSTDWDDVLAEAWKMKTQVVPRFRAFLRMQNSRRKSNWGHKPRGPRRKAQYRANWQRLQTC